MPTPNPMTEERIEDARAALVEKAQTCATTMLIELCDIAKRHGLTLQADTLEALTERLCDDFSDQVKVGLDGSTYPMNYRQICVMLAQDFKPKYGLAGELFSCFASSDPAQQLKALNSLRDSSKSEPV